MSFWDSLARRLCGNRQDPTNTGSAPGTPAQPIGIALSSAQPGGVLTVAFTGSGPVRTGIDTSIAPRPVPVEQEVVAWRGWLLAKDSEGKPQLRSLHHTLAWDGPSVVADEVPSNDNSNGIYALMLNNPHCIGYKQIASVWGTVALSGIVVEGETGYRGQRATIRSLTVQRHPDELRDMIMLEITAALEDRYQCTVEMDADRIWHNTPDEELVPAHVFSSSAFTQVFPYQFSSAQSTYLFSGVGGLGGIFGSGGRRR